MTPLRVGIYTRVSTSDKDQNPETQLLPLREFCNREGWGIVSEYVDTAPATDLRARTAWRELLEQASKRHVDLLLVWRIDRAFRSVLDSATTLERLRSWGIGWTPRAPSEKPCTTSRPPTLSLSAGFFQNGSRPAWRGLSNRGRDLGAPAEPTQ